MTTSFTLLDLACRKRVIGLEPTTFTLATCKPTEANSCTDNDLRTVGDTPRSAGAATSAKRPPQTLARRSEESDGEVADAQLAAVISAWPTLLPAVKAGIGAMVRASADTAKRAGE